MIGGKTFSIDEDDRSVMDEDSTQPGSTKLTKWILQNSSTLEPNCQKTQQDLHIMPTWNIYSIKMLLLVWNDDKKVQWQLSFPRNEV